MLVSWNRSEWKAPDYEDYYKGPSPVSLEASLFPRSQAGYQVDTKTLSIVVMKQNAAYDSEEAWNLILVLLLSN